MIDKIDRLAEAAAQGIKTRIVLKMNALTDQPLSVASMVGFITLAGICLHRCDHHALCHCSPSGCGQRTITGTTRSLESDDSVVE
jgi:hypothetical protein